MHHAEDLAMFRAAVLDVLPRVLPSRYTSYNEIASDGTPLVALVAPQPAPELLASWARYGHQSPLVQHHLTTRDPRAHRLSDVIDLDRFRELELYQEVFVPMGVEHQLAVTLPAPPTLLIGLVVAAPEDFTDAQRHMLDHARPHLIQAHANAALRERVHDVLVALESGLDDAGEAIVVVGQHDRIEFSTAGGRAMLEMLGDEDGPEPRRLPDVLRGDQPAHQVLPMPGTSAVVVRRLPGPQGSATVLVFERTARGASRGLLEALGLTAREAEVLQAIMQGRSTIAIAAELGVSRRTVYKHTERIYSKLGVNERAAAVSAAWAALDSGRTQPAQTA